MCDNMCREKGFRFFEHSGYCDRRRKCSSDDDNVRRLKQGEEQVTCFKVEGAGRAEGLSREDLGSFWYETTLAQDVGTFHHPKSLGRMADVRQNGTDGRVGTRDAVQGAMTCVSKVCQCARHIMRGSQATGQFIWKLLGKRQARRMGKCEGERMPQPGESKKMRADRALAQDVFFFFGSARTPSLSPIPA